MTSKENTIDKMNEIKTEEDIINFELPNKNIGIAKRMLAAQKDLKIILKTEKTFYGKSFKIEDLMLKIQPALNMHGIILGDYKIVFDKDAPVNPLIYYPSKELDDRGNQLKAFIRTPKTTTTRTVKGDTDNPEKKYKENEIITETITENSSQILGKTVVFYKFSGKWTNADDKKDFISIEFSIPAELKENLSFEQSLGLAVTYTFRTNLARQFNIPTPDSDADFENASAEVKEELKTTIKDNEFSKAYNDIVTLDNKSPYVLKKEQEFMTNLKPIFGDCNSFYEYLKYKYIENIKDIKTRVAFRNELKNEYTKIYEAKIKGATK